MAVPALEGAPVLSTPDTHIFEDPTPAVDPSNLPRLSDEQVVLTYEIERTVREIREGKWKRIALQFPDHMLGDAPRVYDHLTRGLKKERKGQSSSEREKSRQPLNDTTAPTVEEELATDMNKARLQDSGGVVEEKLFILGDTSYGACCVDEVAAEHVDADVVVHYGRSCLSPPSRLPVIYVFTERELDIDATIATFKETYQEKDQKVVLMADIPYSHHIPRLYQHLHEDGYTNLHATEIVHKPSSPLPNRTVPQEVQEKGNDALRDYALFHISDPPTSLLLALSSRVSSIHIYPTTEPASSASLASTSKTLNRRYALITSLSTTPIFGILINTLSVKNYMHILSHVQQQIAAAGKKSYTFVVGKVNAAKVANFSEVGGWVVIGCWESSLIESRDFWRPMITPWELGVALKGDAERVWTGAWEPDFQKVLDEDVKKEQRQTISGAGQEVEGEEAGNEDPDYDSEDESQPPEFDLRTGQYVSHARPMRSAAARNTAKAVANGDGALSASSALAKRANGDVAAVGGVASPGAEYLRSNRTWQGLGSDYQNGEDGEEGVGSARAAKMEEGRSGIARGYVVGDEGRIH
ncbi:hypothetical protein COCC4DRAFT_191737 [Bipolaris maydis ATCC 48331]|uniref:2-(3-amino-3-carboxypropyl)histidine synthase subunit 2 n=2 Tax=Cochliobolus heterostrophus TaxID=5016 RepID=M2V087_COCH5|nr:uncharacterized protein COCC4DRAFT_191737 [Bipolaris maydis ATCC 48331]EMD93453.1 hypothetical protein COCHEDRAFT_1223178 [Bipolaris maydis C5]KAH7562385.1 hypothetical protein BM1_01905 [Bipolaris maydis]ENI07099.1 hypothetical protein COCC4DRAFT_191737 [Bipolaris maydis ATCC 48331]KAJ5027772.1 putative diphthamide synthesis protein-domain-containing protein [Bipolaris maydis]KAJ5062528.1 diphthamide biosynthesis protein 2 [Bipolaris maydis]